MHLGRMAEFINFDSQNGRRKKSENTKRIEKREVRLARLS
jgi:hypothetical protein